MKETLSILLVLLLAPLLGGLLMGADRRLSARFQGRIGPPITQSFYDVLKLLGKAPQSCNDFQWISVSIYLATMILSLWMLVTGQDMLVLLFVLALGSIMLILGAFSVRSPYAQLGAQREILQMLAYEPLLIFMVAAIYLRTGSFAGSDIFKLEQPLLLSMPLFLLTQTIVMAIKLHKSPFDISASHHAHQEIVRGIYTEFSGPQLALIEMAHWYEVILLLGFVAMLWHTNWLIGVLLALAVFVGVIVLDNITARLTWRWMLRFSWTIGLGLCLINLGALYLMMPMMPGGAR
jgi:ech hydrogenase subunit B